MTELSALGEETERKVLLTDGDFRMVSSVDRFQLCYFQHHHPDNKDTRTVYDWEDGWKYCWQMDSKCSVCKKDVPAALTGFMKLIEWNR